MKWSAIAKSLRNTDLNFKNVNLQRFRSWILLRPLGKKEQKTDILAPPD
jgi:hypothetical protein